MNGSEIDVKPYIADQFGIGNHRELMMTSSNGNIFSVTGHLCGEFTGHRWIPRTKASDVEFWYFRWSVPEQTVWVSNRVTGDLRRRRTHYDVTVVWWIHLEWLVMRTVFHFHDAIMDQENFVIHYGRYQPNRRRHGNLSLRQHIFLYLTKKRKVFFRVFLAAISYWIIHVLLWGMIFCYERTITLGPVKFASKMLMPWIFFNAHAHCYNHLNSE